MIRRFAQRDLHYFRICVVLCCILLLPASASGCTIFAITPGASDDGAAYLGHTNDGVGKDWRNLDDVMITYIPPAEHKPGERRPVYFDPNSGSDAAGGKASDSSRIILGYIDQVPYTYGYYTASYGIINDQNLMSAECTDYAKYEPSAEEGRRLFYSSELSNIALERCTRAEEAVLLVGDLIDRYGYYGTGETLIFADSEEAWVIEMCGNPEGNGGLWVAEKVPDGEIFVAANTFRIRDVTPGDPTMHHSKNLFSVAEKAGWWSPSDGPLDWLATVSYGEYAHPYYSLMRVWRLQDTLAPSLNLSPYVEDSYTRAYPFSFTPDKPVNFSTALNLFRDHYEGTEFDLTKSPAAGPFGNPYRYLGPEDAHTNFQNETTIEVRAGANPRPISAIFCSYSYVTVVRPDLRKEVAGVLWFGPAVAYETVYAPIYANSENVSASYSTGSRLRYNYDTSYWTFALLTNWAMLRYDAMIGDIQHRQEFLEEMSYQMLQITDQKATNRLQAGDSAGARSIMTNFTVQWGDEIIDTWKQLTATLIVKYSNGLVTDPITEEVTEGGYPDWWYNETGYQYGPRVYQYKELRETPDLTYTGERVVVPKGSSFADIQKLL
ncbi:dipeptidase [Methanocalculus sp.]|uniref:dipeptidase n=1 Tax=Methanocalculus sp. TaxID=2004547 RepID=UPI002724C0C6|nr:C69 family dipeptidase [Methanocalculus sp.]MDO8842346.1 C69 family dipeptidase [Methanocalculus sp.]